MTLDTGLDETFCSSGGVLDRNEVRLLEVAIGQVLSCLLNQFQLHMVIFPVVVLKSRHDGIPLVFMWFFPNNIFVHEA